MVEFVYKVDRHVPCYSPLKGYFGKEFDPVTRKRRIVFSLSAAYSGIGVALPCGQCIGCKLERSRQWAVRIVQEMRMHSESAFLTLTYSESRIPANGTLVKRDLQLFMKRLRKRREQGLRFFACGEYGETTFRPHYHVLLLNTCFRDQLFWKMSGEHQLMRSAELSALWDAGEHFIGNVTFRSAAYVARYCTKKVTGPAAEAHYYGREPEFTCMSRRPGIGYPYFVRYGDECYRHDNCVVDGREVGLPRYYDGKFEEKNPDRLSELKLLRRREASKHKVDNTPDRLRVRERVAALELATFKREMKR